MKQKTRHLVYIPVIHSRIEASHAPGPLTRDGIATELWWDVIMEAVGPKPLPKNVTWHLYSDSITEVNGINMQIIHALAEIGSRHCQLMRRFIHEGALLETTENAKALKAYLRNRTNKNLNARDTFIARRINATLGPGEWGILMIGKDHEAWYGLLDRDIIRHSLLTFYDLEKFQRWTTSI